MPSRLTLPQARRCALAAQGFGRSRPATVTMRQLQGVIDQVAQFQIDSINVAVRAHYVPLFARLGGYDVSLLDRAASTAPRRLYEYWGHAACLLDVTLEPALRLRTRRRTLTEWPSVQQILEAKPDFVERVLADITATGPLTPREIENVEQRSRDHWGWNWSEAKHVLEYLFDTGVVSVAGRNNAFERRYDLTSRVIPARIRSAPDPTDEESYLTLVARAARALGVADLHALSEYFYLRKVPVARAISSLVDSGSLEPVTVAGLAQPFWRWHQSALPRRMTGAALVSPFDSLVFERQRLEQLFGVDYRVEIYTPAAKRRYGYYCYLFVMDDQIVARVDLKAERARGVLVVQAAWLEEGAVTSGAEVAPRLAAELVTMADWLGLGAVEVRPRGTLATALDKALKSTV